ncbi:TraB family protein [Burkholderiales bacterium GJ-E10]|nr:TraB family protein [Burkholderiales bacterium GJ-E10]
MSGRYRYWALVPGSALVGSAWLWGGDSLAGPALSIGLALVVTLGQAATQRFLIAAAYYLPGCWPIVGAVTGYWGSSHAGAALGAWIGASILLALPWSLPPRRGGLLLAAALTALPPLGVIGWLSPWNAAGVLFPSWGWGGVLGIFAALAALPAAMRASRPAQGMLAAVLAVSVCANIVAAASPPPHAPRGWVGVQTRVPPDRGDVLVEIRNSQALVADGLRQGAGARVVVFPESVLPDWYPGTRAQFAAAVPPKQIWLLGAQTGTRDAVVRAGPGDADPVPVATAAGLLLGGDWLPWKAASLRPAWWQKVFTVDGQRVWAALCIEQLQPWTWLEAMAQRPKLILAQSNAWWAGESNAGPSIQRASTRGWARLMALPVVWAGNRVLSKDAEPYKRVGRPISKTAAPG